MAATQEQLEKFVQQVRAGRSVEFPSVARSVGLNWFKDVKPLLETNPIFYEALQEVLEEMKYELYQCLLKTGRDGKSGRPPEIAYIKEVIKFIDSGAILGKSTAGLGEGGDAGLAEHLEALLKGGKRDG